jgi:ethanolamine ammonia-lyase large subunit
VILKSTINNKTFNFESIRDLLGKANEEKSGDVLCGIAAASATERVAAKLCLANLTVKDIYENPVIPYEKDQVTRVIYDGVDKKIYHKICNWTIGELREFLLRSGTTQDDILNIGRGLTSEAVAAAAKLMTNMDLICVSKKIKIQTHCRTTIGFPGTIAFRNQPNHPADSIDGIIASVKEGLSYGSGDAVIGVNPAIDTVENYNRIIDSLHQLVEKYSIPTQTCVLAHVTTQMKAMKTGTQVDLVFQSLAGTEAANDAFGITVEMLDEALNMGQEYCPSEGPNIMYFETGQGSEVSLDLHDNVDEMTLESRCYGLARRYNPFMLNNVSGFIGPETIYSGKEVLRADLEDLFMGKVQGIPMGIAPCYTNHMDADQNDQELGTVLCAMAGANYFMGVAAGDDCMLSYQDTSYHDDATIREILGLRPSPEFEKWMENYGLIKNGKLTDLAGDPSIFD